MAPVYIIGAGMTAFQKPRGLVDYPELGLEAATKALVDAGINYDEVQEAYVGYCYGDSTCGQRALYSLGMTSIPITNVNNNCSTGSTALYLAKQSVGSGQADCALALGFEKMAPGSLTSKFDDRANPMEKTMVMLGEVRGIGMGPGAAQIFGGGGAEYCERYGATREHIAAIAAKNHRHSVKNPYSQFRNDMTVEQVLADKPVTEFLTRAMCCPTSDGGACAIIASERFVKSHKLENQAIEIVASVMTTDSAKLFEEKSAIELTGSDMTRLAAKRAYDIAKVTPDDIKVIELHDCFAANELLVYDALGLCEPGKAHTVVDKGDNTFGGKWVINPSGGLESKGHPLGATGLGMAFYICMQLRGWAGPMQIPELIPGASSKEEYGLIHNLGLGGSCVVSILKRPSFYRQGGQDGRDRMGYNHGAECKALDEKHVQQVRSRNQFSEFQYAKL